MKLSLYRSIATQPPKDTLPFGLVRLLGQADDINPPPPKTPVPNPFGKTIAGEYQVKIGKTQALARCYAITQAPIAAVGCLNTSYRPSHPLANCHRPVVRPFDNLWACAVSSLINPIPILECMGAAVRFNVFVYRCHTAPTSHTLRFNHCRTIYTAQTDDLHTCQHLPLSALSNYRTCGAVWQKSDFIYACTSTKIQQSLPVPCRFYPLPKPPPPPSSRSCQLPPPSDRLPFKLTYKSERPDNYPFALKCWHDDYVIITPPNTGYIMHNTITAHLAGKKIEPLSFSIKTDMASFCWQGQIELPYTVDISDNPQITVNINGLLFVILAEELTHNRAFASTSVTISGRSISAQLSAEYGKSKAVTETLYASQLINEQLANLGITANYLIRDYLIQDGVYTGNQKSIIAVIDDVAKAAGGFIYSDPANATIHLKPRYKVPAWELATASPDKIVPLSAIQKMTISHRQNPRYNSVWLVGQIGGQVYRQGQDRTQDAPSSDNPLYNDPAIIDAGIAMLSDSGNHKIITVQTILSDKYQMSLAKLGDIWQIDGQNAIVTAVSVDVKSDNGVPIISQTVTLDGYNDL